MKNIGKKATRAFISAAIESNTDECIPWPFSSTRGRVMINGKRYMVTHFVLLSVGLSRPSAHYHAAHAPCVCHNPSCINPRHLRWATACENNADKKLDGTWQVGERNAQSKLTRKQARAIVRDNRSGPVLADIYGVSRSTINRIKCGSSWPDLTRRVAATRQPTP